MKVEVNYKSGVIAMDIRCQDKKGSREYHWDVC